MSRKGEKCLCCHRIVDYIGHHIITRGSGKRIDEPWNLLPLCTPHHTTGPEAVHVIGLTKLSQDYVQVEFWLIKHGWEFCEIRKKWFRRAR